jgi:hypothetical protein
MKTKRLERTLVMLAAIGMSGFANSAPICGQITNIRINAGQFRYLYANGSDYYFSTILLSDTKSYNVVTWDSGDKTNLTIALSGGLRICLEAQNFAQGQTPAVPLYTVSSISK